MQVSSRPASASVQAAAQRLSQGKASLAQSLVEFDPALAPAMQYNLWQRLCLPGESACPGKGKCCPLSSRRHMLDPDCSCLPAVWGHRHVAMSCTLSAHAAV